MLKNNWIFLILMVVSGIIAQLCFNYAYSVRGYYAIGGEYLALFLPMFLIYHKILVILDILKENKKNDIS